MTRSNRLSPGFVRVYIPSRGKTTRIRQQHANNPSFLDKHGMVLMPEPSAPPVSVPIPPVAPPPPAPVSNISDRYPNTPVIKADNNDMKPSKVKR